MRGVRDRWPVAGQGHRCPRCNAIQRGWALVILVLLSLMGGIEGFRHVVSVPPKGLPPLHRTLRKGYQLRPALGRVCEVHLAAQRWEWLMSGKEIGGEARDLLSSGGEQDGSHRNLLRRVARLLRGRGARTVGLLMLLLGGAVSLAGRRGVLWQTSSSSSTSSPGAVKTRTERFLKPKSEGEGSVEPGASREEAVPLLVAPKSGSSSTGDVKGKIEGQQSQQQQQQQQQLPGGAAADATGGDDAVKAKRKRWTPFADFRKKVRSGRPEDATVEKKGTTTTEGEGERGLAEVPELVEVVPSVPEEGGATGTGEREAPALPLQEAPPQDGEKGAEELDDPAPLEEEQSRQGQGKAANEQQPEGEGEELEEDLNLEWAERRRAVLLGGKKGSSGEGLSLTPDRGTSRSLVTIPPSEAGPRGHHASSSFVSSVFKSVGPAVPRVDCVKLFQGKVKFSSGSGVIFNPEGYIITNSLLVRNALELKVTLADGHEYPAEIRGMDEVMDVAVLKILGDPPEGSASSSLLGGGGPQEFAYAPIGDSDSLQVGDWVLSIGSPKSPGPSVILGIVSGLTRTAGEVGRPETQVSYIQTDSSFDSGVVGGPLVNEFGEVVGINSIGMSTSSTVQFSVPINQIKEAITELANGGVSQHKAGLVLRRPNDGPTVRHVMNLCLWRLGLEQPVVHPSIGVEMMPITPSLATKLNHQARASQGESLPPRIQYIPEGGAVVVVSVLEDSPAQLAGLQTLDILLEIEQRPIYNVEDAQRIIKAAGVGRDLEVKVLRRNQEVTLRVKTTDFATLFRNQERRAFADMRKDRERERKQESQGQEHKGEGGDERAPPQGDEPEGEAGKDHQIESSLSSLAAQHRLL